MIQTVQLVIADAVYAAALREALTRSGPWQVVTVQQPDPRHQGVLVLDEDALDRMPARICHPERVVLVADQDPQHLSRAWDAGIVSVVSRTEPPNTVVLAVMAAALRVPKAQAAVVLGGISPNRPLPSAPISPEDPPIPSKRSKHR